MPLSQSGSRSTRELSGGSAGHSFPLARVFLAGMIISFLGSLPLGLLNVAALQLSISDGYVAAFWFVGGCTVVEMIYVRLSLVMMDRIMRHEGFFKVLKYVSVLILAGLSLHSFMAAWKNEVRVDSVLSHHGLHPFLVGIMLMAVNPVQIPFWFGWNTILYTRHILQPRTDYYNIYPIGIGVGSLLGSAVFIFGGQLLVRILKDKQNILNWILGGLFLAFAIVQLWKVLHDRKKEVSASS